MCIGFALLADCASLDIFLYEGCKTGPPEFGSNQLTGFQVSRVTCCVVVMATAENDLSERGVRRNVDTIFVCENAFGVLPIGETRAKSRGNGAIYRLQGLEDERIGSRRGLDLVGEGGVDEVNKEGRWKKGDSFIFRGSGRE